MDERNEKRDDSDADKPKHSAKKNPKLAREARVKCEKWREYFTLNNEKYHYMHNFILGDQWTDDERDDMLKDYNKNALTANKVHALKNSLLGEQQQNTPQIQVYPKSNCNEKVAEMRELITKDIMFSSDPKIAYQESAKQGAIGGYGVFLLDTEYEGKKSFNLTPKYRYFKDATRTFFDIGAEEVNKTDGMFSGYYQRVTRLKFREEHGKDLESEILHVGSVTQTKEEIALAVQPNVANDPFNWADGESITIIHYFKRKLAKKTQLFELSNGRCVTQDELDELMQESQKKNQQMMLMQMQQQMQQLQSPEQQGQMQEQPQEPQQEMQQPEQEGNFIALWDGDEQVRIQKQKPYDLYKIVHYKIAGDFILDETDFPSCEHLPLVFVDYASYYDKAGKQVTKSFFDELVDTQIYINYLRTQSAYVLKCSRYDQWIGSKKNVASLDTRQAWTDPFTIKGMLTYDESPNGNKPEQIRPPELSQSLFMQYELAIQDLYTSSGMYPARMGDSGDAISGKANDSRTRQGSYATYLFFSSVNRAIETGGKILNEMIPILYDTERVLSLMTPDGRRDITVNKMDEFGNIENDIRKGSYEVKLLPGPSYEGQKQEAIDSLLQVLSIAPDKFNMIADLFTENLPLPNSLEIRNRFKTLVPPEIIEAGKSGNMPQQQGPTPEQQAMQLEQQKMQQEAAMDAKELELKEKELELKKQEIMMEAQFKIQELEAQRLESAAKLQEQELRYMAETERTQSDAQIAHADNLVKILTHKVAKD